MADTLTIVLVICSTFSCLCTCFILYTYWMYTPLRRFPANMTMWRATADFIFSLHILVTAAWITDQRDDNGIDGHGSSTPSETRAAHDQCVALNFVRQFSLSASLGWFFCVTVNYFLSVRNPFKRPDQRSTVYHVFVWSMSLITAIIAAIRSEYRAEFGLCYTGRTENFNAVNWLSFIGWLLGFWLCACCALCYCWFQLRGAEYQKVLQSRKDLLQFSLRNVSIFTVYWTCVGACYVAIYEFEHNRTLSFSSAQRRHMYQAFSGLLSCMGMVDFLSWMLTSKQRYFQAQSYASISDVLSRSTTSRLYEQLRENDISAALRREFIINTTRGIQESVLLHQRRAHLAAQQTVRTSVSGAGANSAEGVRLRNKRSMQHDGGYARIVDDDDDDIAQDAGDSSIIDDVKHNTTSTTTSTIGAVAMAAAAASSSSAVPHNNNNNNHNDDPVSRSVAVAIDEELFLDSEVRPPPITLARSAPGTEIFLFQDYHPLLFERLRMEVFGITNTEYIESLTGESNDVEIIEEFFSEGRSGSFLYLSPNRRFIVKTLTYTEHSNLLRFVRPYYRYMSRLAAEREELDEAAGGAQSLINRIYGCYSIQMYGHTQYFVVIKNCLYSPPGVRIHEKYDLKGSWQDRSIDPLSSRQAVRKDNDFRETIYLERKTSESIMIQMCRDVYFLESLNIMDYSLLLGVHRCREERVNLDTHCTAIPSTKPHSQSFDLQHQLKLESRIAAPNVYQAYFGGVPASPYVGPGIYYVGMIDVLQHWDWSKRFEHWSKRLFRCYDPYSMSSIPPRQYAERFIISMLERFSLSVTCLADLPYVRLSVRGLRLDDSDMRRHLPELKRREYLIRMEYRSRLVVEVWEHVEVVLQCTNATFRAAVQEYERDHRLSMAQGRRQLSAEERAMQRGSFYGYSSRVNASASSTHL